MQTYTHKTEKEKKAEELQQRELQELLKKELAQELKADIHRAQIELATVPDLSPERKAALVDLIDTSESIFFNMGDNFHL